MRGKKMTTFEIFWDMDNGHIVPVGKIEASSPFEALTKFRKENSDYSDQKTTRLKCFPLNQKKGCEIRLITPDEKLPKGKLRRIK
jgi:hypothetical protein